MKTRSAASLLCGTFPIKQLLSKSGTAALGRGPFRGVKTLLVWSISHLQRGPDAHQRHERRVWWREPRKTTERDQTTWLSKLMREDALDLFMPASPYFPTHLQ